MAAKSTELKVGVYLNADGEYETPWVCVDADKISVLWQKAEGQEEEVMAQFTYEELRGLMAIMAGHQEKRNIYIQASAKQN
jgi:hypothetical protein